MSYTPLPIFHQMMTLGIGINSGQSIINSGKENPYKLLVSRHIEGIFESRCSYYVEFFVALTTKRKLIDVRIGWFGLVRFYGTSTVTGY